MDIQELLSRVGQNLSVSRSFGAAYEKDGAMIIPVAFVAGGGGGGEGTGPASSASGDESAHDHGASASSEELPGGSGGGFGGVVMPMGAYVVKDDRVRWVPAISANVAIFAGLIVLRMFMRARRRARRHQG
jgi:uncharacterized spore protein YtfJ